MANLIRSSLAGLLGLLVALSGLLPTSAALADELRAWTLQQTSGQVHVAKSGFTPVSLTIGDQLAAGDWIETGSNGRAVLTRGEESIVVAPNSRIGLPAEPPSGLETQILQNLGTILLNVKKKARQHFEVRTPYLAAVVKGTSFTVSVQRDRGVVHVVDGLVEVTAVASNESVLIRPGQTVVVPEGAGPRIDGANPSPADETQASSAGQGVMISDTLGVVALDAAATTGGLIGHIENDTVLDDWSGLGTAASQASLSSNLGGSGSTTLEVSGGLSAGPIGADLGGLDINGSLDLGAGGADMGALLGTGSDPVGSLVGPATGGLGNSLTGGSAP